MVSTSGPWSADVSVPVPQEATSAADRRVFIATNGTPAHGTL